MDTLYSIVSLVGLAALGVAVAEMFCRFAPKLTSTEMPDSYLASLHGLRGILALVVVVHACWAWFGYTGTSYWAAPSELIENAGRISVLLFFALSAYLYWEKLRGGNFELRAFYRNRFRRLAPAYGMLLVVLCAVLLVRSNFHWNDKQTLGHLIPWLSFGFLADYGSINGIDLKVVHASALSTLTTQWFFYLTIPFLAWFTRGHRALLLLAAAMGIAMIPPLTFGTHGGQVFHDIARLYWPTGGFALGILASYLMRLPKASKFFKNAAAAPIALACLAGAIFLANSHWLGQPTPYVAALALVFFLVVASGENFRGALAHRSVRWLGNISYSLFLFHGAVIYIALQLLPASMQLNTQNWGKAFTVFAVVNVLVLVVAALSHRFIEKRFVSRRGRDSYGDRVVSIRKAA